MFRRVGETGKGLDEAQSEHSVGPVAESAKHRSFIDQVLDDLESLEVDQALKIPLSDLPNSAANTLSLLRTAARKKGTCLEAQADANFLYVWNTLPKSRPS